ncbi:hypothetical protein OIO90_004690 [Microbotryomycetes sp. JL221]|nr:hypothetical protein OIO90_004690 [Microbotryomycetes sp. JL221]
MGPGASPLVGVAICVAGKFYDSVACFVSSRRNTCISVALNVQKLAHKRLSSKHGQRKDAYRSTERSRLLPDGQTPNGVPTEPALLSRSVSDPELHRVPSSSVLIPNGGLGARPRQYMRTDSAASHNSSLGASRGESSVDNGGGTKSKGRAQTSESAQRPRTDKKYLREPLWWLGISLMALGEFGNFLSYAFAPASLVAPLGSIALVANVGLAPLIVKEPFRKRDLLGCLIAFLGGATVVYSSKSSDKQLFPGEVLAAITTPLFLGYAGGSILCIGILAYLSRTRFGDRFVLIDLGICALSGGFTVLSTKAISSFLTLLFVDAFRYWITYPILLVLLSTALVQVNFINKALQRFEARLVIPIQFMTFSLSTIVGSAVLYREFDNVDLPTLLNFAFGCALSALGVWLITKDPAQDEEDKTREQSLPRPVTHSGTSVPRIAIDSPVSTRSRKLSLTLGGTQYLLAHSPAKSTSLLQARLEASGDEDHENDDGLGLLQNNDNL